MVEWQAQRSQQYLGHSVSGVLLHQWRQQAMQQAIAHDISPSEVDWLLQAVSSLDRLALRLESFHAKSAIALDIAFEDLQQRWQQRIEMRSPLQYLVGYTQWRQFRLAVSPAVLIPRPETELIIDLAIAATQDNPALRQGHWVDLGTGSGAIALGLADAFPQATVHAVDCSTEALAIAQQNAHEHGLDHIYFHQGHWLSPFSPLSHSPTSFSGILSNPPYIPSDIVLNLQPEVTHHEPHLALDGGTDGLDCIRHITTNAPPHLVPGGILLLEIMAGQAETVGSLLAQNHQYKGMECHTDLAGIQRFILARHHPEST
ncbi:MAG: peptide chain release factor N(5)-glutamine methyltransferase [Cyanothece sp. SIO2G6]|nr:peptide chain release factor N(5)-glutamine methyltransferase [Cyanothece sp. SIO2G6]